MGPVRLPALARSFALRSAALALFTSAAFVACGSHPGGSVGDPCDSAGSSAECLSDEICDDIYDGGRYCLFICSDHVDCAGGERCNGVTGSDLKACHPEGDGFEDDDDFDDDGCPVGEPDCKKGK